MLRQAAGLLVFTVAVLALGPAAPGSRATAPVASLPRPDHILVVVMENHSYEEIVGNPSAPYLNGLRALGASFTDSHAVAHPSEPNYLALFAGTTEGLSDDSCPHAFSDANLGSELAQAGSTFAGYSESMPSNGYTGCSSGDYARKHNPWVNFGSVPSSSNRTFDEFPSDYSLLPAVAFVVPNLCHDMHDCDVATGDGWLRDHIEPYRLWAMDHDSLLVVTFDEGTDSANRIPTIFAGPMVVTGDVSTRIDHYSVLRTLEDLSGVAPTGNAAAAATISSVFAAPTPSPTPTAEPSPSRTPTANPEMPVQRGRGRSRGPILVPFRPTIAPTFVPTAVAESRSVLASRESEVA